MDSSNIMQEPGDVRQRRNRNKREPDSRPEAAQVPESDIIEEQVTFSASEILEDGDDTQATSPKANDEIDIQSGSSNEITTIVIDDSEDDQLDDPSDGASDSHQHELRSKIAQQLLGEQHQQQQQLLQQQQHRRHRARNSRNQVTCAKVNSSSISRLKRTSSKVNNSGNLVELLSDSSDHDGDIDNSDNGYEEEDKDSDDRDHDVRDIYNQAKLATDSNDDYATKATDSGPNVFSRFDKLRQDRSSSLRLRTRSTRNKNRLRQEHEDLHSKASVDGNDGSGDGSQSYVYPKFDGFGAKTSTDYNNNTANSDGKHFINSNSHSSCPDLNERYNRHSYSSQSKEDSYKCSECEPASNVFSGTISRVLNLIQGDKSSSKSHSPLCKHQSRVTVSGKSTFDKLKKSSIAHDGELIQSNLDKVTEWQDQQELVAPISGKRKRVNMPNAINSNYQTLAGPSARKSFKSGKQRETFGLHDKNGYTKLGHSYQQKSPRTSFLHELKRVLLLLLIIVVCGFVLWQAYEVLVEEDNYLGVVKYSPSELGEYKHYAVSTDAAPCAKIGKDLLAKGGHAVDAAIGTLICMGVVLPNSLGLGGGCLMTIYDNTTKSGIVVDGRETAPDYATENMFAGNPLGASRGPLSIGVPGELAAYWEAHQRFGRLKWSQLFDASIELAENGFETVEHLSSALRDLNHAKFITPILAKLLTNNATGEYYYEGEIMYQRELARTLRRIRDNGVNEFYNGQTGQLFIEDLKKQGGKMTMENLRNYRPVVKNATEFRLNDDLKVLTQPVPGSGVVLGIILRIMQELGYYKNLKPKSNFESASLYYHHLAEAFKFAYAQRAALEDDPDDSTRMDQLMAKITSDEFIRDVVSKITDDKTHPSAYYGGLEYFQEDHGTAHTSVIDNEGNSVAITTSVNLYFGSGLVSPSTGIIYNDVMDDFVSPNLTNKFQLSPTKYNHIRPGKRPLSSMAPSVFVDGKGNPKLIIGASGGSKITTAIAMVALRNLFFDENIKTAIDSSRIHHQFLPDKIMFEANFPSEILNSLDDRGHKLGLITGRSSVVMAVACNYRNSSKFITANSDYRKGGTVAGA